MNKQHIDALKRLAAEEVARLDAERAAATTGSTLMPDRWDGDPICAARARCDC
jgi:hypothetical protein